MKKIVWLFVLTLFVACRPDEREIPYEVIEPKWVMNSRVDEFGGVWVSLSYSLPANYSGGQKNLAEQLEAIMIDRAQVVLSYRASSYEFEEVAKGVYYLNSAPLRAGNTAEIEVRDIAGKLKLKSTCTIPKTVEINRQDVFGKVRGQDTVFFADIRIQKPESEQAWYLVSIGKSSDLLRLRNAGKPTLADVVGDRSFLEKRAFLLHSEDFQGDSVVLKKALSFANASDTLLVNVAQIDRQYYRYVDAVLRSSGWLQQLLGDAINLQGNVEYGLGYFTLHKTKSKAVVLKNRVR